MIEAGLMQHARLPPRDNPCGSLWHRWDPHILAPRTVLNDQFAGADPLEGTVKLSGLGGQSPVQ